MTAEGFRVARVPVEGAGEKAKGGYCSRMGLLGWTYHGVSLAWEEWDVWMVSVLGMMCEVY
jgi:hypothetical protein